MDQKPTQDLILSSLKAWEAIRGNAGMLDTYFSQGDLFELSYTWPQGELSYNDMLPIHAYPGILEDHLTFFLIPSWLDNEEHPDYENNVQICPVLPLGNGTSPLIPDSVAKQRIGWWADNRVAWTELQTQTGCGVYQAFVIPGFDVSVGTPTVYLAMCQNASEYAFVADLVIDGPLHENENAFYDTVRPVPPFKPYTKKSFYLLGLAGG